MTRAPKYVVGQLVEKWTGQYGGPGRVRGIANEDGQPLRYLVGHRIEGGFGEFYHVYAEGNLREVEGFSELPVREVSIAEGLRQRTGQAEPENTDNTELMLIDAHRQVDTKDTDNTELVDALVEAHRQVDSLMAQVIIMDRFFMPSQSPLWPEIVKRAELLQKHGVSP